MRVEDIQCWVSRSDRKPVGKMNQQELTQLTQELFEQGWTSKEIVEAFRGSK
jgi:hypothetical protein